MGAKAVREEARMNCKSTEETKCKEVKLFVEICASWGYGGKKDQVLGLIKELNNQGYNVDYVFEPMQGGNSEYFIYVVKEGKKLLVFTNDSSKPFFYGGKITKTNMPQIIFAIEKLV